MLHNKHHLQVCLGKRSDPSFFFTNIGVSEWLFNINSAIFQLYYGENELIFNEMVMTSALY